MHLRLELGSDLAMFYTCIYLPGYKTVATGSYGGKTLSLFVDGYILKNSVTLIKKAWSYSVGALLYGNTGGGRTRPRDTFVN